MARLKSKYREYRDGGRVDQPGQDELPIEPTEAPAPEVPAAAPPVDRQPEPPAESPPQHDDATLALKKQIEGLRQSEQMNRQQAAMPQQQPMTREAKLALWRQGGMSDAESHFLQQNPEMIDHSDLTGFVVEQARQAGLQRGSDAHFDFVKKAFDSHLQAQANPAMQTPATPTPKFKPPPASTPKQSSFGATPRQHQSATNYCREGRYQKPCRAMAEPTPL